MNSEKKDRGKVASQLIEGARLNIDVLDNVKFGSVTFHIKNGDVWRMEINISKMLKNEEKR